MGNSVCVFWEDDPGEDGFVRVTRMHHQPDRLDAETRARGVVASPGKAPDVRAGWRVGLWATYWNS
jgi:hypothetical protein